MKKIKPLLLVVALAFLFITIGCQGNKNDESMYNRKDRNNPVEKTRHDNKRGDDIIDRDRSTRNNRNNTLDNRRVEDRTNHMSNRTENRYEVADEAADKITDKIDDIDYAYVLTTNHNAYVAAVLDDKGENADRDNKSVKQDRSRNGNNDTDRTRDMNNTTDADELTDDVKKEISDIVKSVDDDIDNVYVTTNPDFANLTSDYVNDMNDGRPVRGFFDKIGQMIERVFPQDKR